MNLMLPCRRLASSLLRHPGGSVLQMGCTLAGGPIDAQRNLHNNVLNSVSCDEDHQLSGTYRVQVQNIAETKAPSLELASILAQQVVAKQVRLLQGISGTIGIHGRTTEACLAGQSMRQEHLLAFSIGRRSFATLSDVDIREKVEDINSKFAEAREEIDLAMEAADTVFFNEEALGAKQLVDEVLGAFRSLLDQVDERKRGELQRSMGMKMEQLKAEAAQLDEASS